MNKVLIAAILLFCNIGAYSQYIGGIGDGFSGGNELVNVPIVVPLLSEPLNNALDLPCNPLLKWQQVESVTSYSLQVSLNLNFSDIVVNETGLEETEFQLTDLEYSTSYFWRVNATDGLQTSPWSAIWNFATEEKPLDVLTINLISGWNLISSNVLPIEPAMETVFNETQNLVIVKNNIGQKYIPAYGINQIGNWDITQGYYVFVSSPSVLQIQGTLANPTEISINLNQGWNLVSYLRNSPMIAPNAFQSISNGMLFVKDRKGNIYHPGFGINTIGNIKTGQGYLIYMNSAAVLTYPEN